MRYLRLLILVLATAALAACGGGGGGSPSNSNTPTNPNFTSTDYTIFSSTAGGVVTLKAYDPATDTISTIPTTSLAGGVAIFDGTIDPTTQATSNLHISGVLYFDNGAFYSVGTAQSGKLAVTRRSSYSGTVCSYRLTNNYLVFTDPGSDSSCGTSDDRVFAVTTSMASTDSPIALPVEPLVVLFSDYTTPVGLLYVSGGTLYLSDATGQNVQILLGTVSSVSELGVVGRNVLLDIDGELEVLNGTSKTLVDSGYATANILEEAISDGSEYYFFDGMDLYSIPVAGGSYAFVATVPTVTGILVRYVHNDYLVYSADDSSSGISISTIDSVDLKLGSVRVLDTTYSPVSVSVVGYGGDYIYYETSTQGSSDHSSDIAGAIKDDGSGRQETMGASWMGGIISSTIPLGQGFFSKYMALDKYALDGSGNITGGSMSVYDAATDAVTSDQGSLPSGITAFLGVSFGGTDFYGAYRDTSGSLYLAHMNATIANSMQQLDVTTAAVSDKVIAPY